MTTFAEIDKLARGIESKEGPLTPQDTAIAPIFTSEFASRIESIRRAVDVLGQPDNIANAVQVLAEDLEDRWPGVFSGGRQSSQMAAAEVLGGEAGTASAPDRNASEERSSPGADRDTSPSDPDGPVSSGALSIEHDPHSDTQWVPISKSELGELLGFGKTTFRKWLDQHQDVVKEKVRTAKQVEIRLDRLKALQERSVGSSGKKG